MFIVLNKQKMGSYLILLSTVLVLFCLAVGVKKEETIQTDSSIVYKENNSFNTNEINKFNYRRMPSRR